MSAFLSRIYPFGLSALKIIIHFAYYGKHRLFASVLLAPALLVFPNREIALLSLCYISLRPNSGANYAFGVGTVNSLYYASFSLRLSYLGGKG
jgi:hypothetical protein